MATDEVESSKVEPNEIETSKMETRKMETSPTPAPLTPSTPRDHPASPVQDARSADAGSAPARPKGLNASPVILGLVALLFAGLVIAQETLRLQVDWSRMGPGTIVGIGVVMVLIGAIGLARRRDNV